jgi:membrane protease YdiL (CAAX protease family)
LDRTSIPTAGDGFPIGRPSVRRLIGWLFLGLILWLVAASVAERNWPTFDSAWSTLLADLFLYLWVGYWVVRHWQKGRLDLPGLLGQPQQLVHVRSLVRLASLLVAFSLGALWAVWYPVSLVAPSFVEEWILTDPELFTLPGEPGHSLVTNALEGVIVVLVAPIVEEVVFRGILLNRWGSRWGMRVGLLLSSVVFSLLHQDPLGSFVFSIAMAGLYMQSGSLLLPIAAHALNNTVAVCLWGLEVALHDAAGALENFRADAWWGLSLFVLTAPWAFRHVRRHWPAADGPVPYLALKGQPDLVTADSSA